MGSSDFESPFLYISQISSLFRCLLHLQCSRLSSVCPLHPATMTTYTTWTRQKACVTFLTSPSSTSDPWDFCQWVVPKHANLPSFSPRVCPFAVGKKRRSKANMICLAFKDNSALMQWAHTDCYSMYSLLKKYSREQNIFLTAFSRKHTNKWQIIIFLDYVW